MIDAQSSLINSLRETQELLNSRLDEIDILSNIVRLLTPETEKETFYIELAELLFSRNEVERIFFYTYLEKLKPEWQMEMFDSDISFKTFKIEKNILTAIEKKEVIFSEEKNKNAVFIPFLLGSQIFGAISLHFSAAKNLSPFSRPFYYLLGNLNASALKTIDEMKRIKNKTDYLSKENKMLKEIITGIGEQENTFVFQSSSMSDLVEKIDKVKNYDIDILVTGESGTGKDLLTRYIHFSSNRKDFPFIAINCAAIPENLIEGELFGIEEGVATGVKKRTGKFEQADKGTIFLDEIGELPLNAQAKLLRFLQNKTITPVGSIIDKKIDVRVIAATNRNLELMVKDGKFREDLFYRLNNFPVYMPSLKERTEDIVPLFLYFFKFFSKKYNKDNLTLEPNIENSLISYTWPGNVRELKNRVLQAIIIADSGDEISAKSLGIKSANIVVSPQKTEQKAISLLESNVVNISDWMKKEQEKIEKEAFLVALKQAGGVKKKAAEILDMSLRSFHYKIKQLGIKDKEF